ncbi:MAG: beta-1,6-N-acetylglucosaminyltransferase [Syntrophobacteraceae bacterium]
MKIAYLITAYHNQKHLKKMINRLYCCDSSFFIHVDLKSNIEQFSDIIGDNVFFTKSRLPVYWGEYSMVEAILLLMREALYYSLDYDYFVLFSGSDYPLRSTEYIHDFFVKKKGTEFISMVKMPNWDAGFPLWRMDKMCLPSTRPFSRFVVRALGKMNLANRNHARYLNGLQPWGGSTWWALTKDACRYILKFVEENGSICNYFKHISCAEEMLFQTILGNSAFSERIHRSLIFMDWSAGGAHPAMIGPRHLALFEAGDKIVMNDAFGPGEVLFARKFSDNDPEKVRKIDEMIERKG